MIDFKQKIEETEKELINEPKKHEEEKVLANLKKNRKLKNYLIAIFAIVFILSGKVIMSSQGVSEWLTNNPFWDRVMHLTENEDKLIKGEKEDRINILLLGIGGANHDGGYLADTIMLASIKPSTKQVALISIPRDLSLPNQDGRWQKINSVHAYAEARESGSGGEAMMNLLDFNLNLPIHYYVRLDFQGFIQVIDELGGIEVNVENTLNDYRYPIMGQEENQNYYARYEHLSIEKGLQKMDGSLALKYARSRYAGGVEGSDFARARRQQLILSAVKEKLLSKNNLLKPMMLSRIISELNRNIKTNLDIWEMLKLWNDYKGINKDEIINQVFDDGPGGLLMATRGEDGAYLLIPQTGNFKEIEDKVLSIFGEVKIIDNKSNKVEDETAVEIEKIDKLVKVTVLNGTWISGLAAQNALQLQEYGFKINETANAPTRSYENSVIYDLSYGKELKALEILKAVSQAKIAYDAPSWLEVYKNKAEQSDFILIVGAETE
jgi:LCP family protein required for cell wall assembly